jgi:hypothetical protein
MLHPFRLADIEAAYDLFSHQHDGVMKVAIRPWAGAPAPRFPAQGHSHFTALRGAGARYSLLPHAARNRTAEPCFG